MWPYMRLARYPPSALLLLWLAKYYSPAAYRRSLGVYMKTMEEIRKELAQWFCVERNKIIKNVFLKLWMGRV